MLNYVDVYELNYNDVSNLASLEAAWNQLRQATGPKDLTLDVIEHIDYSLHLKRNLTQLSRRLQVKTYRPRPVHGLRSTKAAGLTRRTVILDIEDAIVSQALIYRFGAYLNATLSPSVFSVRWTGRPRKPFRGWYNDWPKYQKKLRAMIDPTDWLVVSDITGYFDNIDPRILKEYLLRLHKIHPDVVDLAMFILESWMYRQQYGVSIDRGVPQAALDFPQALSNFFLYRHDERVIAAKPKGYVRWVDDMNVVVRSEIEGKQIITVIEDSLERIFLTPNSSKTQLLDAPNVASYFLFDENDFVDDWQRRLKLAQRAGQPVRPLEVELNRRFRSFRRQPRRGSWDKVFKRYYTCYKRLNSKALISRIYEDLKTDPSIDDKVYDYALGIDYDPRLLHGILDYLESNHNQYESTEARLVELILHLRVPVTESRTRVLRFIRRTVFGPREAHWYVRCLAALVLAKYGSPSDISRMARHVADSMDHADNGQWKRYLLAVTLMLSPGHVDRERAWKEARLQTDPELARLIRLEDEIQPMTALPAVLRGRLTTKVLAEPRRRWLSMRTFLLLRALAYKSTLHHSLRGAVGRLERENEDPIMAHKLTTLAAEIA